VAKFAAGVIDIGGKFAKFAGGTLTGEYVRGNFQKNSK
jgi:hypothetical protein